MQPSPTVVCPRGTAIGITRAQMSKGVWIGCEPSVANTVPTRDTTAKRSTGRAWSTNSCPTSTALPTSISCWVRLAPEGGSGPTCWPLMAPVVCRDIWKGGVSHRNVAVVGERRRIEQPSGIAVPETGEQRRAPLGLHPMAIEQVVRAPSKCQSSRSRVKAATTATVG